MTDYGCVWLLFSRAGQAYVKTFDAAKGKNVYKMDKQCLKFIMSGDSAISYRAFTEPLAEFFIKEKTPGNMLCRLLRPYLDQGAQQGATYRAHILSVETPVFNPYCLFKKEKSRSYVFQQTQLDFVAQVTKDSVDATTGKGETKGHIVVGEYKTLMETHNPLHDRILNTKNIRQVIANARMLEAMTNVVCSYGVIFYMTRRGWRPGQKDAAADAEKEGGAAPEPTTPELTPKNRKQTSTQPPTKPPSDDNVAYAVAFPLTLFDDEATKIESFFDKTFAATMLCPYGVKTSVLYSDYRCRAAFKSAERFQSAQEEAQLPFLTVWDTLRVSKNLQEVSVAVVNNTTGTNTWALQPMFEGFTRQLNVGAVDAGKTVRVVLKANGTAQPIALAAPPLPPETPSQPPPPKHRVVRRFLLPAAAAGAAADRGGRACVLCMGGVQPLDG
jgi:hypothetical protein